MKRFLILLLSVSVSSVAYSQVGFGLGIKGGPNFASTISSESTDAAYESRTGWHAGLFTQVKLTKLGIQPEFIISSQGSKVNTAALTDVVYNKVTYFNIPVMLQYYMFKVVNIQVGPQFGILMDAKSVYQDNAEDIKELYTQSDLGIAFGLGLDLPMGLTATARYNLGLSDTLESSAEELKNRVIMVSIGYKFINR